MQKFFPHIKNFHKNIKFTMEKKSNGKTAGELFSLLQFNKVSTTLLNRENEKVSVLVYRKPAHTNQ